MVDSVHFKGKVYYEMAEKLVKMLGMRK
jgi:hypothetical protein